MCTYTSNMIEIAEAHSVNEIVHVQKHVGMSTSRMFNQTYEWWLAPATKDGNGKPNVTDKFYDGNLSDLEPSRVATSYYSQMAASDISWNCSIQFLQFLPLYSFHFNQFTPSGNLFSSRLLHLLFELSIQLCYCANNLQTTTKSPN